MSFYGYSIIHSYCTAHQVNISVKLGFGKMRVYFVSRNMRSGNGTKYFAWFNMKLLPIIENGEVCTSVYIYIYFIYGTNGRGSSFGCERRGPFWQRFISLSSFRDIGGEMGFHFWKYVASNNDLKNVFLQWWEEEGDLIL